MADNGARKNVLSNLSPDSVHVGQRFGKDERKNTGEVRECTEVSDHTAPEGRRQPKDNQPQVNTDNGRLPAGTIASRQTPELG